MHTTLYYLPGYQAYERLLQLQHRLHALRVAQQIGDTVLVLEHAPVITIGRTPEAERHVLASREWLRQQGIAVCATDRGGDVTYHGPGQITVYYILELVERDVHLFVNRLERSVIALLADYGVRGAVDANYPGVWVDDAKICALGVAVKKWVSFHGIALNVCPDISHFQAIVPCGIQQKAVTSLQQLAARRTADWNEEIEAVKRAYIRHFAATFQRITQEAPVDDLWRMLSL